MRDCLTRNMPDEVREMIDQGLIEGMGFDEEDLMK
jgi:hypothetical protein